MQDTHSVSKKLGENWWKWFKDEEKNIIYCLKKQKNVILLYHDIPPLSPTSILRSLGQKIEEELGKRERRVL